METKVNLHDELPPDRSASVDDLQHLEAIKAAERDLNGPRESSPQSISLKPIKLDNDINQERNSDDDKEARSVGSPNFLRRERSVDDKQVHSEGEACSDSGNEEIDDASPRKGP